MRSRQSPGGHANNYDGLNSILSDVVRAVLTRHPGLASSLDHLPRGRRIESSVPQPCHIARRRTPTADLEYDRLRRSQPPVSNQRKTNLRFVAQVLPGQTRRAQFRRISTQQREDCQPSEQLDPADHFVEPLKSTNKFHQSSGIRVFASLLRPPGVIERFLGCRRLIEIRLRIDLKRQKTIPFDC